VESQVRIGALLQGLQQLGWSIGTNLRVDYRWAGPNPDVIRKHATELVAIAPDVIVAHGISTLGPLLDATRTIPLVFPIASDPVGGGVVEGLAHPGGNATGFSVNEYGLGGKWLELLKEIAPSVTRAAILRDPRLASGTGQFGAMQSVAPSLGVELHPINVKEPKEIERAVVAFARDPNRGLMCRMGREARFTAI
jgi:ABC-type uncharacterized transport system substrate-binding protein